MTREEAVRILSDGILPFNPIDPDKFFEAYHMAIDALNQEPKTGHWIHSTKKGVLPDVYTCSVCGWKIDTCRGLMQDIGHRLYCEHCGAKMEVGD